MRDTLEHELTAPPRFDLAIGAYSVVWLALGAFAMGGLIGGLVAFFAGGAGF